MSIILATKEEEVAESWSEAGPGKNARSCLKSKIRRKRARGMAGRW
jgi:hypothetical protein